MRDLTPVTLGEDVTIAELAALVQQVVGYEGRIVFDASKPDGTSRKLMEIARLAEAGWRARTSLHDGLRWARADFIAAPQG